MKHPEPDPRRRADHLHVLQVLVAMLEDPHRFLDVVLAAPDEVTVLAALLEQFGLDEVQAKAAIDMQFRMMSERARQLILEEADMLRSPGGQ